ncbi:hypothetical protein GCM10023149_34090 [Mucilaginibacter gynuensis]|uniref:Uncharacterized protein n=1 Tax=Mucilaginibacter gynuensis TaxID=1302236 RepID=A0ABP8GSV2_9SPHI
MSIADQNIPEQREGEHNDVIQYVDLPTVAEAHHLFILVKDRLKDVSNWHTFTGPVESKFGITDTQGRETYKIVEKGDHIYIDMPGPGSISGGGYDWVRVEALREHDNAEAESEYVAITVRPVANPKKPGSVIAHFFSHNSTNTFIVERYRNRVSAAVHGRNEQPNTDGNLIDDIRNIIVGLTARHSLSGPHWQVFVDNILKQG